MIDLIKRIRRVPWVNALTTSTLRVAMRYSEHAWQLVVTHVPRLGHVSTALPNGRRLQLITDTFDPMVNAVFWGGWNGFEPDVSPLFYELATRARITFDVGAHIGFYTLVAGHANPAGRVFAIEPFERPLAALRRHVAANRLTNVEIIDKAAGRAAGRQEFYFVPTEGIPSSSSLSHDFMRQAHEKLQHHAVEVIALDDLVEQHGLEVDLVKIDTETTETDVLAGMNRTLARCRPHVILEMLAGVSADAINELVLPLGYRPHLLTRDCAVPYERVGVLPGNWYLLPPSDR